MSKLSLVSCIWSNSKAEGAIPCGRSGHSVVTYQDELVIFGGSHCQEVKGGFTTTYLNDMYCLSILSDVITWRSLNQYGNVPSPRDCHSCRIINNKMYLFGGKNSPAQDESLEGMYKFDPETRRWTKPTAAGKRPLTIGHSASCFTTKIYTFGGLHEGKASNQLTVYDTELNIWQKVEATGAYPKCRCDHSSEIVNGTLYVFGGVTNVNEWLNDLHTFDIGSSTWCQAQIRGLPPTPRCLHTFVAHRDKDIYVFGGWRKERGRHDVLQGLRKLSVGNQKWKNVFCAGDDPPEPRHGHCAVICHSKMYVIGGMEVNGEADMDRIHALRMINPSDRKLVVSHALTDLENT